MKRISDFKKEQDSDFDSFISKLIKQEASKQIEEKMKELKLEKQKIDNLLEEAKNYKQKVIDDTNKSKELIDALKFDKLYIKITCRYCGYYERCPHGRDLCISSHIVDSIEDIDKEDYEYLYLLSDYKISKLEEI